VVFDGEHLLILQFQAPTLDSLLDANSDVTVLLFASHCGTLRYGLFRAMALQLRRMQAATAPALTLGGLVRRYRWPSGDPWWSREDDDNGDDNGAEVDPGAGVARMFDLEHGAWFWALDGVPLFDAENSYVWDTLSLYHPAPL
jgi:hypothetical protein